MKQTSVGNGQLNPKYHKTNGRSRPLVFPEFCTFQACVIVSLLAAFCYIHSIDGDFVFDDTEAVVNNEDVRPETPLGQVFRNDFWGTSITSNNSHKSYRPLTILSFRLNYAFSGGLVPRDFRVTNLVLHAIVSAMSVLIFNQIWKESQPHLSFICAVIFAIHPVHSEAVAGIVGRADLLCCLFYFLSILTYVRHLRTHHWAYFAVSMTCCAVAMLCKEQGITVLGVNAIYDLIIILKLNLRHLPAKWSLVKDAGIRLAWMATVGSILLYGRWAVMGSAAPSFQQVDNPASFSSSLTTRILTYNYIYSIHALLLVLPHWLCFDWSMGCIPLVETVWDARNLASVCLWMLLSSATYQALFSADSQKRRYLSLCLALTVVPFLPATNVFFRVGFVVAERILFVSVAGYCILVVYGMEKLKQLLPMSKVWELCLTGVLIVFIAKTCIRSAEWTSEARLFRSALKVCPLNAKVHYNIGKNAADQGLKDLAVSEYQLALELNPYYDQAMNNLANLLKDSGQLASAEALLLKAVSVRPDFAAAWMNKGIVEALLKKHDQAKSSYLTALTFRRKYPDCYYNLGNLYLELGQYEEAHDAFRNATSHNPRHVLAWTNLIVMLDNTGQLERSEAVAYEALKILPNEANLHFSLAGTLGKQGRFSESEHHFRTAIRLKPDNPSFHVNLGVLYHRWKRYEDAEKFYHKALSLDANSKSAVENLRLLHKVKHGGKHVSLA